MFRPMGVVLKGVQEIFMSLSVLNLFELFLTNWLVKLSTEMVFVPFKF